MARGATLLANSPHKEMDMKFDWHAGPITRATPIDSGYRNTQKVREFLVSECGDSFKFDRTFMAWIKSGAPANMGDVADQWRRIHTL